MEQIVYKCGHIDPDYYREDIRPLKIIEARTQNCWKCADAELKNQGMVYDARIGSYSTPAVMVETAKIANDPTLFVDRGDYAPNENVNDGNGYGD